MNIKKDFGMRVKELRSKRNITQYQLAEMVEIDPKHMSHIETGRSFPKADLIEKLANALKIEYAELFKSKHLQDREFIIKSINQTLSNLSYDELSLIYKIINGIIN